MADTDPRHVLSMKGPAVAAATAAIERKSQAAVTKAPIVLCGLKDVFFAYPQARADVQPGIQCQRVYN